MRALSSAAATMYASPTMPLHAMPRFAAATALAAALLTGCATRQSRADAYEQALAQWQGASEELLVARWGKPRTDERIGTERWLTYVVDTAGARASGPTVGISIGGFGFGGGRVGLGGGVGVSTPIGGGSAPSRPCTTRFLIEGGKVSTWAFDGPGCGAAD